MAEAHNKRALLLFVVF